MSLTIFAMGRSPFVALAIAALVAGCAVHEDAAGPPPAEQASVGVQAGVAVQPDVAPPPPDDPTVADSEVVYDPAPPVVDIEAYPSVVYDGVTVYYVGGVWYRHDGRGWGAYHHEPRELARQRAVHERDPRWVEARERHPQSPPERGVTERQPETRSPAPAPERTGVAPAKPPQRKKGEPATDAPKGARKAPQKGRPSPAPARNPESR